MKAVGASRGRAREGSPSHVGRVGGGVGGGGSGSPKKMSVPGYESNLRPILVFFFYITHVRGVRNRSYAYANCMLQLSLSQTSPVFTCMHYKSLKSTAGKGEIARNEQFLLFPQGYLPVWRLFCHFHQIWNCRLQALSVWRSLKFVIWETVNTVQLMAVCIMFRKFTVYRARQLDLSLALQVLTFVR